MTIAVAVKCVDGVAIAVDSMLTVKGFAQQQGQKIHRIDGPQLFAFAGDLGLAERFRAIAAAHCSQLNAQMHRLDYAIQISSQALQNFALTGVSPGSCELQAFLGFIHGGKPQVCVFEGGLQPRFLDDHHFVATMGSGAVAADPFLKFLIDVLLDGRQPTIAEGRLLATWAVSYPIKTMAGSVGGPIDISTIEINLAGDWEFKEHEQSSVFEIIQAIDSACDSLRQWAAELGNPLTTEIVPRLQG